MDKQILIYKGRLKIKKAGLIRLLDDFDFTQAPIPAGIPIDHFSHKFEDGNQDGTFPRFGFEGDTNTTKTYTFWHDDTQYTRGENIAFGLIQFNVGHVELNTPAQDGDRFTDVSIVSEWPPLRPYYDEIAEKLQILFKERCKEFPHSQDYLLETIQNLYQHGKLLRGYLLGAAPKNDSGFIQLEIGIGPLRKRIGYVIIGKINDNHSMIDSFGYDLDFLKFFDELIPILSQYTSEKVIKAPSMQEIENLQISHPTADYSIDYYLEFAKGKTQKNHLTLIACVAYIKEPNSPGSIGLMRQVYDPFRAQRDELDKLKQTKPDTPGIDLAIESFDSVFPFLTAKDLPESEILRQLAVKILNDYDQYLSGPEQDQYFVNNLDRIPADKRLILEQVRSMPLDQMGDLLAASPLVEKWRKDFDYSNLDQIGKSAGSIPENDLLVEPAQDELSYKAIIAGTNFEDQTGWDLILIEMWNNGHTDIEIAARVHVGKDRVNNRKAELRKLFKENGKIVLPYKKERKNQIVKKS